VTDGTGGQNRLSTANFMLYARLVTLQSHSGKSRQVRPS